MNELVSQLADQAKNSVPRGVLDADMWIAEYNRIFAELIVRECANIALREDHDPYECILKHFGIK
jgi:hypothetical protein